ncbi:hypothetical protein [Desulfovibrio sp.]|uniref:hypothetical protein n=1 Tax=Desulfovibrio sp. TaxID=885 RepID=UPI003D0E3A67
MPGERKASKGKSLTAVQALSDLPTAPALPTVPAFPLFRHFPLFRSFSLFRPFRLFDLRTKNGARLTVATVNPIPSGRRRSKPAAV